ncbi:MAG: o-succinylbenzoate synthase [Longimicrobiales bacterium]
MLKLESIRLREIRLPLREPFRISSGVVAERRIALLELGDGDGLSAWSECVAGEHPNYGPETVDTAWHAIVSWLAPRLLRTSLGAPAEVKGLLEDGIRGHLMAKAALEMGCWTLEAERRGIALAELLGGVREWVPVGISLGIQASPEALVERARAAYDAGYRKIKLKIAPGADVEYIAAVREALGPGAPLMADANSAYDLADSAHLARLDAFALLMIEQPLYAGDLVRHASLQRLLRTPICLDESITSRRDAEDMIELGSGRIVNIKPGRVGGLAESIAIHDVCAAHGMPVWCGGMLESGIGRACNLALATLPNFKIPGDLSPSARYWERDVVTPEWTMDGNGGMRVPLDRPGLGVTVDVDRIDDLTVREELLTAS